MSLACTCTDTFVGLEICVRVPLAYNSVFTWVGLLLYTSYSDTTSYSCLRLYCRGRSIVRVLVFAGLNELVVIRNSFRDVLVQCEWIYVSV